MSKPTNSFLIFCKNKRKGLQSENKNLSNSEISSLLGKIWRQMSSKEKEPFIQEAKVLKDVSLIILTIYFTNTKHSFYRNLSQLLLPEIKTINFRSR